MSSHTKDFHGGKRTKEKTMDDDGAQDRFSELPESLIVKILSMLELRYAIRTGVVAKNWKNIWTNVDKFIFKYNEDGLNDETDELEVETDAEDETGVATDSEDESGVATDAEERFLSNIIDYNDLVSSVDRSLRKCTTTVINRFYLNGVSAVSWMLFALDRNVKMMELRNCEAPTALFQSSTITNMELYRVEFDLSTQANLSSLKSLRLDNPFSYCESIEKLVMGCPVLENLVLDDFRQFQLHLNIKSSSLKTLKLRWFTYEIKFLTIEAPLLEDLEIIDTCFEKCHLVDVSSLVKSTLIFYPAYLPTEDIFASKESLTIYNDEIESSYKWILMATELLKSLSFVGELIVGSELIQALFLSKLSGTPSPLFMCKHLSIETHIWKFDLPGIAFLLENAPHLETLLIKVVPFEFDSKDAFPLYQTLKLFHDEDPHLNMPNGKCPLLKTVQIEYCQNSCYDNIQDNHGGAFDYEILEYVLKSAVVLKKLVMFSSRGWSCTDSTCQIPNCSFQYVPSMCRKLMNTFPSGTGNEPAGWELKRSKNKLEVPFSNYASLLSIADSSSSSA